MAASASVSVAHVLAEIEFRRRLNAECAAAHIGAIEIELQDLAFGQMDSSQTARKASLILRSKRTLVRQKQVLRQLLRDRRAALHHAGRARIDGQRAQRADDVDAPMSKKRRSSVASTAWIRYSGSCRA